MNDILSKYLPENAVERVFGLIKQHNVHLKIVNERATRHGDYRRTYGGKHIITVNSSLNKYRFLITLIHEIAHLVAFEKYGTNIKPHGSEWKYTFKVLMVPFINTSVFPDSMIRVVAKHFINPKASSDTDAVLSMALQKYDFKEKYVGKNFLNDLPQGCYFRIKDGRVFQKGSLIVKRYKCMEVKTQNLYFFKPNAVVELVKL